MPTCTQCGTAFGATRSTAAYCSPACRQRAYRTRNQPTPSRNTTPVTVTAGERERIEREAYARGKADATTTIDWDTLPAKVKDREAVMRRVIRRELDNEFEPRVQAEVSARVGAVYRQAKEMDDEARRVLDARKGVFSKADYDVIRSCLHPDSRHSASDAKLAKAFRLVDGAKLPLLKEADYQRSRQPSRRRRICGSGGGGARGV